MFTNIMSVLRIPKVIIPLYRNCSKSIRTYEVGSKGTLTKTFTYADVKSFADLSGDSNPLHLNEEYASTTRFGRCVVHGALVNGLVSAVMGTVVPGYGTILVHEELNFTKPLFIGEKVTAEVVINEVKKKVINCNFKCFTDDGKIVIEGSARVIMSN